MIRLKDLLSEALPTHGSEPLDGKSKTNAKNWVHGKIDKYTKGFFSDNHWKPVHEIWKEFDRQELNWSHTNSEYQQELVQFTDGSKHNVPVRKLWSFEIKFINNRDKPDVLYGQITAAGAGSVEDPLDRYDVTVTLS